MDEPIDDQEVMPSQEWRSEKRRLKDEFRHLKREAHAAADPETRAAAIGAVHAKAQQITELVQRRGRLPRDTVVGCRVDAEDLDAIDALVEAGIRLTRSEAASWFIREGINSQRGLLDEVRETVAQIRRLRAEAQAKMHDRISQ